MAPMIEVKFFSSVREALGVADTRVEAVGIGSVAELVRALVSREGPIFAEVLGQKNMLIAVNQVMVKLNHAVADGDEVAFFPPVTGG